MINNDKPVKNVVLGISGGVAAYKAAELARRLIDAGMVVRVVMTASATRFISPLTLAALTGSRVFTALFDEQQKDIMPHIELARWADLILVAPASANILARLAHGFADDLLTAVCLASDSRIAVAPAMHRAMWQNRRTQENVRRLQQQGILVWGPETGLQACGEDGMGRMSEPEQLLSMICFHTPSLGLKGLKCLISAGPTREAIDPVRFISNRSSGRMGFAVAEAAAREGAEVTLVSGPVVLPTPAGVIERIDVITAEEMLQVVIPRARQTDIFVAVAAVADYRPVHAEKNKLKKKADRIDLACEKTPDIVAAVSALANAPYTVGFAAETEKLEENAELKRRAKQLDMIAVNQVGTGDIGFDGEMNELLVLWKGGRKYLPRASKNEIARSLLEIVAEKYHEKN